MITAGLSTIEDLDTEKLRLLMMTIHARLHKKVGTLSTASLNSEEMFPDDIEFLPDPGYEPENVNRVNEALNPF